MSDGQDSTKALWPSIVQLHNQTKDIFARAEEMELHEFRSFLQPISEHRHAYEHLVRAKANEYGLDGDPLDVAYQIKSLRRCLGHEYRAFFDCADWYGVVLRERIHAELRFFSPQALNSVFPEWYATHKIRVVEINEAIAKIRTEKDIARERNPDESTECGPEVIPEVEAYRKDLDELEQIYRTVLQKLSALADYRGREIGIAMLKWAGAFAACIITALIAYWLGAGSGASP